MSTNSYEGNISEDDIVRVKVVSPIFTTNENSSQKRQWQLELFKDGKLGSSGCPEEESVLKLTSLNHSLIAAVVNCSIKSEGGNYSNTGNYSIKHFCKTDNTCVVWLFPKLRLPIKSKSKPQIQNHPFGGMGTFYHSETAAKLTCTISEIPFAETRTDAVCQDLGSLFQDSTFSDFTVCCQDGEKFPVHRAILAARSPVFKRMLENDLKESKTSQVEIQDMTSEVVKEVLLFMYTGRSPNTKKLCTDHSLLLAAEKYEILDLKQICEIEVAKNITVKNVCEELQFAGDLKCDHLKGECLKFIHDHHGEITKMY